MCVFVFVYVCVCVCACRVCVFPVYSELGAWSRTVRGERGVRVTLYNWHPLCLGPKV